ncbi:MAG TPA: ABC transporter permease [Blastocatellia bacterium]|jgi:predicted permease|nr:ABC transporter permease [Blastocatellia bacterium]
MTWLRVFIHRLRGLFLKRKLEQELEDEIRAHLDMQIEDNLRQGMSPDEARYEALRKFGGVEQVKESYRDRRTLSVVDSTLQDLRYALHMLRRSPGFAVVAILLLALGIGGNTALFSIVDAVFLKSLPVKAPEQLVMLTHTTHVMRLMSADGFFYGNYKRFRDQDQTLSGVLAYHPLRLTVSVNGQPEPALSGQLVTGNYYTVLGVNAALGRTISPEDDQKPGAQPVCVISDGYWQRRFGRDPGVVGKTIHLSGLPFTIIGVTPPEFFGAEVGTAMDISVPATMRRQLVPGFFGDDAIDSQFRVLGRLRPEATLEQAQVSLGLLFQQSMADLAASLGSEDPKERLTVVSGSKGLSELRRQFSQPLFALTCVAGLALLIACANVAGLLLARGVARRKEMAVRLTLGAGRLRLVRQLLTESLLLSSLGSLLGLLFAWWGDRLLLPLLSQREIPLRLSLDPDLRLFGFTAAISALTSLLFGLAPALVATRIELQSALKQDAPGLSGRRAQSFGQVFVIAQVALSLLLLVGAGLFVRSLQKLQQVPTGFSRENVLVLKLEPTNNSVSKLDTPQLTAFYNELLRRVEALPGVRQASLVEYSPISRREWLMKGRTPETKWPLEVEGRPGEKLKAGSMSVYPNSFATLGIPFIAGRDFGPQDSRESQEVAVISESVARHFFGAENPIGRRFTPYTDSPPQIEIIGVVRDAKYKSLREPSGPMFYMPYAQFGPASGSMTLVVRTAGDPVPIAVAAQREARTLDPAMPRYEAETLAAQLDVSLTQERLVATLSSVFGLLALVLVCVGLYGVLAYDVARRTHEIGIRMALGANARQIVRLALGETLWMVGIGIVIGLGATWAATRWVASLLFGLQPQDPLTIGLAVLVLLAVAAVAGYLPARRATRVDPLVALKYE